MTENKAVLNFFIYLLLIFFSFRSFRFGGFVSVVSVVLFRSFCFGRFGGFVSAVSFRCFGF